MLNIVFVSLILGALHPLLALAIPTPTDAAPQQATCISGTYDGSCGSALKVYSNGAPPLCCALTQQTTQPVFSPVIWNATATGAAAPVESCISMTSNQCPSSSPVLKDGYCCPPPPSFLHSPPEGVCCGLTIAKDTCVGYLPVGLFEAYFGQYCCSSGFDTSGPPEQEAQGGPGTTAPSNAGGANLTKSLDGGAMAVAPDALPKAQFRAPEIEAIALDRRWINGVGA